MPCRINVRRLWTARIMLESRLHPYSSMVTLTYAPENLPPGGTLVPRHTTLFLKRVRRVVPFRYFYCGEYGDITQRPHYHAIMFGINPLIHRSERCECILCSSWPRGFVHVGLVTPESAAYVAGYTTKKMTSKSDPRLAGRYPEFARMSRNPGLAAAVADKLALHTNTDYGSQHVVNTGGVLKEIRYSGKKYAVGRYLINRIKEKSGYGPRYYEGTNAKIPQRRHASTPLSPWIADALEMASTPEGRGELEQRRKHSALKAAFKNSLKRKKL